MKQWHLVTYDVRDDKRLRRTARILEGYGVRVQYSVFRCRLSARELERLRWELAKVLAPDDDLLVISLCERCVLKIRQTGTRVWPEEPERFLIV